MTTEEIDRLLKDFLAKGGKIKKLATLPPEPSNTITINPFRAMQAAMANRIFIS